MDERDYVRPWWEKLDEGRMLAYVYDPEQNGQTWIPIPATKEGERLVFEIEHQRYEDYMESTYGY